MALIEVKNLVKEFVINKKRSGFKGMFIDLFHAKKTRIRAVDDINFTIDKGEIVGYLGPNGAGKSTTIKIMTGILYPTSGSVSIKGLSPQRDRKKVVRELGVIFGQRTQLTWELRLGESFEFIKRIYQIEDRQYRENLKILTEILSLEKIIDIPTRQLSLGQRMRGDLAAAMLHSPSILFLDEPTIGLDIEAKYAIRKFIRDINRISQVTVILTTHDLNDVEQLCDRIMVINHGKIVEDGPPERLVEKLAPYRVLVVELSSPVANVGHPAAEVIKQERHRVWFRFEKNTITAAELIADLSGNYPVRDLSLREPNIEDVIREVYKVKTG